MARTDNLTNFLTDVADAIREKKGTEETIKASDFDTEIENLPSGESSRDWSEIGYSEEPEFIEDGFAYAKEIYDNWVPTQNLSRKFYNDKNLMIMPLVDTSISDNMQEMFQGCYSLSSIPQLDTSNVKRMSGMFYNCSILKTISLWNTSKVMYMDNMFYNCSKLKTIPLLNTSNVMIMTNMFNRCSILETIPLLDTSKITRMSNIFSGCFNLSDSSLDNILQMCINATSYTETKTLKTIGITNTTYYPVSRIEALPSYQAFLDAGWTIGY